jgi:serine/threonine kinase 32
LFTALKNLHEMNIICKDIRAENLLLTDGGDLSVTYFSRWNLVDEKLSKEAVACSYVAPELCGLVNYPVSEACDWWSFGVIAYEMLTMNVRKL